MYDYDKLLETRPSCRGPSRTQCRPQGRCTCRDHLHHPAADRKAPAAGAAHETPDSRPSLRSSKHQQEQKQELNAFFSKSRGQETNFLVCVCALILPTSVRSCLNKSLKGK